MVKQGTPSRSATRQLPMSPYPSITTAGWPTQVALAVSNLESPCHSLTIPAANVTETFSSFVGKFTVPEPPKRVPRIVYLFTGLQNKV